MNEKSIKPLKILQASAGSGKTFNLAAHYLSLLFDGDNKYREILAVTFTNKATDEMKTRILEVLEGLALGKENVNAYREIILKSNPKLDAQGLRMRANTIYRRILHDYSRFSISTIDGFVQKVIRGFAFELGLSADYSLELNLNKVKDDLLEKLDDSLSNNQQLLEWVIQLAMDKISGGKNWNYKIELRNIIGEIFKESYEIFEENLARLSEEEIGDLFKDYSLSTKKIISDYEGNLEQLVNDAVKTFNSFQLDKSHFVRGSKNWLWKLNAILENDDKKTPKIFALIDDSTLWFKEGKENIELYNKLNPILKKIKLFQEVEGAKYRLALAFGKNLYYVRLMQHVALLLANYRLENGNLLISDAQKLVTGITDEAGDNPSFIWEKVGNRFKNFLFDEFQDTSTRQWKSFRTLLANALATSSENQISHLVVGDVKQSIYRWRAGDWNILHKQLKKDVRPENVIEDNLDENYRSSKNIIDFNNFLYDQIPLLLQKQLNDSIRLQSKHLIEWWSEKGFDDIITNVYSGAAQKYASSSPDGGYIKIERIRGGSRYSETQFREDSINKIIPEIESLLNHHNYKHNDIALLVRSNKEASLCVKKLMARNIPVLSGDALLIANNEAVNLVINTLKVFTGLPEQTALYKANCISLYNTVHGKRADAALYFNLNDKQLSQLGQALPEKLCSSWKNWLQLPLSELIENLFECYELTKLEIHIPYLLAFRDLVANATKLGERGILSFLDWWEEEGIIKTLPSSEDSDAVQIITIHKSKGLAFRAVFIPFCMWETKPMVNSIFWVPATDSLYHQLGNIPLKFNSTLAKSSVAKSYFEELLYGNMDSLNMLYVATTRAKDYLYIATMNQSDEENITTIGNAINVAIQKVDDDFKRTDSHVRGNINHEEIIIEDKAVFALDEYPTSGRLSKLYEVDEEKNIAHLLNIEESGRKGLLAHEILANATTEEEVNNYIDKLLKDGIVRKNETANLNHSVMDVLNNQQINQLFKDANYSFIEKDIIDQRGKLQRPDRILVGEQKVVILDYKFTLQKQTSHEEQVLKYKNLLMQMGYKNVEAYIFYATNNELKKVN